TTSTGESSAIEKQIVTDSIPAPVVDENTKSVGFVAQTHEPLTWAPSEAQDMNEPDRDAWLYCSNLLYSLRSSSVSKAAGSAQATNGEFRRPRLSFISPLDGVLGSTPMEEKDHLPPWMPKSNPKESDLEQRYLRLDVEVTSSRVVSGKGLAPPKAAAATPVSATNESNSESRRHQRQVRSGRINANGGVVKNRRIYDRREQLLRGAQAAAAASRSPSAATCAEELTPLAPIKEEPMEIYIKEEPMD
ncbi:hypothetical protein BGZ65_005851, partial [Modicella reniformis]